MERAARLVSKSSNSQRVIDHEDVIRAVWPAAVGKVVARHTGKLTVVRDTLVVEVEDAIWQKQLYKLSGQIVNRLQKCMSSTLIQQIEFRIGVPKRQMQREENLPVRDGAEDEAESIRDPVLKKVYQLSRKRAMA